MGGASVFLYVSSPEGYFPPPFSRGTVFLPRRVLLIPPQKVVRVLLILLLILPQEVARVLLFLLFFPWEVARVRLSLILPWEVAQILLSLILPLGGRPDISLSVRLHVLWCLSVNVFVPP